MAVAKEQILQIISENNINSVADIYTLLKDSFKDILQELMEAELDATLGYEKNHKGDLQTDNKRNGHSTKSLKSQYGEFQIDIPKEKQEWGSSFKPLIPALCLFLRHLYYCQKFPILFQRSGVGRAHKRQ